MDGALKKNTNEREIDVVELEIETDEQDQASVWPLHGSYSSNAVVIIYRKYF